MYPVDTELFSEPFITYLESRGWMLMPSEPDIAVLRKTFAGREEEIVLPLDRTYADYRQRILEAIRTLSKYEQCREKDIFEEVFFQKWDILSIRINGDRVGHGRLSYSDKMIIEEGFRKTLLASARSVLDPKPYFKRLYSNSAEQWMRSCQAGIPEPGSYVTTMYFPLEENTGNQELPFSRKVGEYLMQSLSQLVELAGHSDSLAAERTSSLNANFCLGLSEMKPDDSSIQFDFTMKWSSVIPVRRGIPAKIEIRDHHFPLIMRVGQKLKPQLEINQSVFIGKILALRGGADESGQMRGEVTLVLLTDDQTLKAKLILGSEHYSVACDAHKQNQYIRISGILSEQPRYSDLTDITLFEVIS